MFFFFNFFSIYRDLSNNNIQKIPKSINKLSKLEIL